MVASGWQQRHVAWIGCVVFALPLIAHAYAGTASRYVSDDYCAGYIFKDHGYLGGQQWFYLNWGAVPATLLLMALTDPAGSHLTPILTTVALVAWVVALTWAVRRITDACGDRWALSASLLIAEVIVYATLQDSPNVVQSLYLRIPMFEYVLPLVALALYAGWLARLRSPDVRASLGGAGRPIVSGVVTFVAGSLGPTYAVLQTATIGVALLLNRLPGPKGPGLHLFRAGPKGPGLHLFRAGPKGPGLHSFGRLHFFRRDERAPLERVLIAGFVGSIVAMALVALGPGNALRQQHYPPPPGFVKLVTWTFLSTVFMFVRPLLPILRGVIAAIVPHVFASDPAWLAKALQMSTSPLTVVVLVTVGALIGFTRDLGPAAASALRATASRAAAGRRWEAGRHREAGRYGSVLIGAPVAAFVLVAACIAPSIYGTSAPPPPRALIEPQFVLVCALVCWSYAAGVRLRASTWWEVGRVLSDPAGPQSRDARLQAVALALVACVVGIIPIVSIAASRQIVRQGREYRAWAARWDEVDGELRAAAAQGVSNARVPALDSIGGVPAIVEDPKDWVNNCAARYYGLESITGVARR